MNYLSEKFRKFSYLKLLFPTRKDPKVMQRTSASGYSTAAHAAPTKNEMTCLEFS